SCLQSPSEVAPAEDQIGIRVQSASTQSNRGDRAPLRKQSPLRVRRSPPPATVSVRVTEDIARHPASQPVPAQPSVPAA
ncbi:MAG: hypothetical protein ACK56I_08125, partial [bacterium]